MNSLFALACVAALATLAFANETVDYCQLHCHPQDASGWDHIACNKTDAPSEQCPENVKVYNFTEMNSYRQQILRIHNMLRNQTAEGNRTLALPMAARMLTMQWDDELAKLAYYNVKECLGEHDFCHRTKIYNNPGQNLAFSVFGIGQILPTESVLIDWATERWLDGRTHMKNPVKDIASFPFKIGFSSVHPAKSFATMILDKNVAVGCSAASYTRSAPVYTLLCNYAHTIETGDRVYETSSTAPGSGCTKKNKRYNNLCAKADTDRAIRLLRKRH